MTIEAKCGCPADAGDATIVIHHGAKCALLPWPQDESLANFWEGWPETARLYRTQKQQQVVRLQTTVYALQDAVLHRDKLLLVTLYALQDHERWAKRPDADPEDGELVKRELARVAQLIRAELRT